MFRVTDHKGVFISFPNGWGISIQWGPGNYGDHHGTTNYDAPRAATVWESTTAETAIIHKSGPWYDPEAKAVVASGSHVDGYLTATQVAALIALTAALPDPTL